MRHSAHRFAAALTGALVIAAGVSVLGADPAPCTYGLPSATGRASSAGGVLSLDLATQGGCGWTASSSSSAALLIAPSAGAGAATVQVTVAPNTDHDARAIDVTIGGQLFVITQPGTACTFTIATPPPFASAAAGSGSFTITTQPLCAWNVSVDNPFVTFTAASGNADAAGAATIAYTLGANTGGTTTRRAQVSVTNADGDVFSGDTTVPFAVIAQAGQSATPVVAWNVGDVFAGLGSWASDGGVYRVMAPDGTLKVGSDLNDGHGVTTTGCMIDPSVAHGDLWTTSWDGLTISRFGDATHQLVSTLSLARAALAAAPRATGVVPVPYTINTVSSRGSILASDDINTSEQLVFDRSGHFFVGTAAAPSSDWGAGHAYLLEFSKNEGAQIAGCGVPGSGPCLLDWWRVDAGGEAPTGTDGAGDNGAWTIAYKTAYTAAAGDQTAKLAAAKVAVAPLAAGIMAQTATGTSGVDELDLSSDGTTVFYTSEDGYIRRFDTATSTQLSPIQITSADGTHPPIGGKAYGFRLLPNGSGQADGSGGFIVTMSIGTFRTDANGRLIKPSGANAIVYDVVPGISHPFALNLTPDAQSFWVATTQEDSSSPTSTGGKVYRFHIATGKRFGPFNFGAGGADGDIQGLCVKREFLAGINQCFVTDKDGKGVLDGSGDPIPTTCRRPTVCRSLGIDETGAPNVDCYAPGEVPLALADRTSFEGDRSGDGGAVDLDLRPLTTVHRVIGLSNLPLDVSPVRDPATGDIIGLTGRVSYNTCPKELQRPDLASDPATVCRSYSVGVNAADGASTSFTWNIHYRNAPASITSSDVTIRALSALTAPTPAADPDVDDGLIARASARVFDPATSSWIPGIPLADFGLSLSSGRFFPSAGGGLAIVGHPTGYPIAAPHYPTVFEITVDLYDCDNSLADGFTPVTDLSAACFHHTATVLEVTVVNELPRFVSGFGPGPVFDPIFINAGVDQFSNKGVSLASAGAEYRVIANDADAHLPVAFTFACATSGGVPNGPGCNPATGLPLGLSDKYATAVPGVFSATPDPLNLSRTNQFVVIGGTPTTPANDLVITVTLSDLAGGRNVDPFSFRWTVYSAPTVSAANQTSRVNVPLAVPYTPTIITVPAATPFTVAYTGLPGGLTYNASTGAISGTPTVPVNVAAVGVTVTQRVAPGVTTTATTSFTWLVYAIGTVSAQTQTTLVNTPAAYQPVLTGMPSTQLPVTWNMQNLPAGLIFNSATGLITGTPTVPVQGQLVTVIVTDTLHNVITTTFQWNVISNRPPVCSAATVTPNLIWPPNHKFVPAIIQNVADPDGDRLTLAITSITQDQPIDATGDGSTQVDGTGVGYPLGAVRAERTGNLRVPEDGRLYQVNFTATDPSGASCAGSVFIGVPHDQGQHSLPSDNTCRWDSTTGAQLTPCAWLHAPALDAADRSNDEGDAVTLQLAAVDADNTPLTYTITGLPPGLTMSPSGLITGAVAAGAAGAKTSKSYSVRATVDDGYGADTETFVWTIRPRPTTVLLAPIPDQADYETDVISLQLGATGPSGATFTYAIQSGTLPAGLTLNPATGRISGAIAAGAAGSATRTYTITVKVTSGALSATDTFVWTVSKLAAGHHSGDGCGDHHHDGTHRDGSPDGHAHGAPRV